MSDAETPLRELDLEPSEVAREALRRYIRDLAGFRYQEAWAHEDSYLRAVRAGAYAERFILNALLGIALDKAPDDLGDVSPYYWAYGQEPSRLIRLSRAALDTTANASAMPYHPLGQAHRAAREALTAFEEVL